MRKMGDFFRHSDVDSAGATSTPVIPVVGIASTKLYQIVLAFLYPKGYKYKS
jgi:hypothetical protein